MLWMSRISSGIPIYALTRNRSTRRKVTLYRGVYPMGVEFDKIGPYNVSQGMVDVLVEKGIASKGDRIIVTRGDLLGGEGGGSNAMKIVDVK